MESLDLKSAAADKGARYAELLPALRSVVAAEPDLIANLANVTAILKEALPEVSWVGFYLLRGGELVLGPFQGKLACTRIALGRGVCGTAAATRTTQVVPDVHAFPGHIACDGGSVVAVTELAYVSMQVRSQTFRVLEMLTAMAIIYWLLGYPQAKLVDWIHRRFGVKE